jgi:hypothetical protein
MQNRKPGLEPGFLPFGTRFPLPQGPVPIQNSEGTPLRSG